MHRPQSCTRRPATQAAAALLAGLFLLATTACTSVNRLREAQDAFNAAAGAENAQRLGGDPNGGLAQLTAARSGYASALLSLEKIEQADEQSLRRDGLWGTALTLRAMAEWRLGKYEAARATATEALGLGDAQVFPRDRALMLAMPGLIKTDQAYARLAGQSHGADARLFEEVKELLVGSHGAVADIQRARAETDGNDPVQVYLVQAQLAAYRNYFVASDLLRDPPTVPLEDDEARRAAAAQLADLARLLRITGAGPTGDELIAYWARTCALPVPR